MNLPATLYSTLKFDADDENDIFHHNYAHSDHPSNYIATLIRQDVLARIKKPIHDAIQSNPMKSYLESLISQKR